MADRVSVLTRPFSQLGRFIAEILVTPGSTETSHTAYQMTSDTVTLHRQPNIREPYQTASGWAGRVGLVVWTAVTKPELLTGFGTAGATRALRRATRDGPLADDDDRATRGRKRPQAFRVGTKLSSFSCG
jgi:hypothetical protein